MPTRIVTHAACLCAIVLVLAALLSSSLAEANASLAGSPEPPRRDEFAKWLVHIQLCYRLDEDPALSRRIAELESQREAAKSAADRRTIKREIDKAKAESQKNRPHAIYGWSAQADDAGKPLGSTRSMTGFIVPATAENDKAIEDAQLAYQRNKPAVITLHRENSADLFTYAGRRWYRVTRAEYRDNPAELREPPAFEVPPARRLTDAQRRSLEVSLKHERSETSDKGNTLHRYWITIRCDQPPANVSQLKLWVAAHVEVNGGTIGPIIDLIEVPRSSKGTFSMSRSFEFIALKGVQMNASATKATPLTITWD